MEKRPYRNYKIDNLLYKPINFCEDRYIIPERYLEREENNQFNEEYKSNKSLNYNVLDCYIPKKNSWSSALFCVLREFSEKEVILKMTKLSIFSIIFGLMLLGVVFFLAGFLTAITVYESKQEKSINNSYATNPNVIYSDSETPRDLLRPGNF